MLAQAFADLKKKIVAGTSLDQHFASDTNSSGTGSHGSSPCRTPTTSTSLQEMAFTFPEQAAQVPTQAQRSRRRASMQDALDHTKINTSLYDKVMEGRQQSICSIQEDAIGSLHLTLDYNWDNALLTVRLIQAQDLVPHEAGSLADPYCKLSIQPHRKQLVQTKVQKQTLSPEFDEEFLFEVLPENLPNRTLEILVYDYDQYSKDECLGQCEIPLESVDLSERAVLWRGVMQYDKKKEEITEYGDLQLQMTYLQSAERLTVTVLKARNLKSLDESKNANPFVKVALTHMNKRMKKKKTSTKKNTLSPSWNEALVFNVGKDMLKHSTIECLVFSDNLLGTSSEPMAKLCIGPESSGDEKMHFKDLLNLRNVSARWHHLVTP